MIGDDRLRPLEPERGNLRQHLPFVGDARAEHVVERRDAIAGDDEQAVAEIVNVAHLALTVGPAVGKRGLENRGGERQQKSSDGSEPASYKVRETLTTTTYRAV